VPATWPGDGKIVLLKPISDNARGANWVGGAGGTTNLWDAIDNTPPVGGASAAGTNTSQTHNGTKATTGNYDVNLTSYTTSGIGACDSITLVVGLWNAGGAATGSVVSIQSNPALGSTSTLSTSTPGTYPTGWNWISDSTIQTVYSPT